jgi:hypothetical protein
MEEFIKMKMRASWISILSLLVIAISIISFILLGHRQSEKISVQQTMIENKDSLITKKSKDSLAIKEKLDGLNQITNSYFSLINSHMYDSLQDYYADTLARYFKNGIKVSKSEIKALEKKYYNWSEDYPKSRFVFAGSPIINNDTVMVRGTFHRSKKDSIPIAFELHFTQNLKINFIRALYYH